MEVKPTLAHGLQKSIGNLWKGNDFSDFIVVVEETSFQCHRFILSACSDFFQGLFRSGMKECQENQARIRGITADTFDVILNSLYKGISGLTEKNVLDVWSATLQLQFGYLTEECESFVIENMSVDSCFIVLKHATMYSAKKVVDHALDFIVKHFEQVKKTEFLLQLSYDYFYKVVSSDYLLADAEDSVLETIIKWMQYMPTLKQGSQTSDGNSTSDANIKDPETNDSLTCSQIVERNAALDYSNSSNNCDGTANLQRESSSIDDRSKNNSAGSILRLTLSNNRSQIKKYEDESCVTEDREQHLFQLITACRLYLISSSCLENILLKNKLILRCRKTYKLLFNAMLYGLHVERRHDPWPELAVHRLSSSMKHGMVFVLDKKCMFYDLNEDFLYTFANLPDAKRFGAITVFDNILHEDYLTTYGDTALSIYTEDKKWIRVNSDNAGMNYAHSLLLAHDGCIYGVCSNELECYHCMHGRKRKWLFCCELNQTEHGYFSFAHGLVSFAHYILVFWTQNNVVTVQCYNTDTKKMHVSTRTMDGTSAGMTSFSHHGDVFILQRNGTLWKIVSSDTEPVDFELITKLWNEDYNLRGCVVYRKQLFVFYLEEQSRVINSATENDTYLETLPTIFSSLKMVAIKTETPCVPMVLPKSWCSD